MRPAKVTGLLSIATLVLLNLINAFNDYGIKTIPLISFYSDQLNGEGIRQVTVIPPGKRVAGQAVHESCIKYISTSYLQYYAEPDSLIHPSKPFPGILYQTFHGINEYAVGNSGHCYIQDCY